MEIKMLHESKIFAITIKKQQKVFSLSVRGLKFDCSVSNQRGESHWSS